MSIISTIGKELTNRRSVPAIYGTFLLGLALYKAAAIWKETSGFKGIGLVRVLIRDQALYFLA